MSEISGRLGSPRDAQDHGREGAWDLRADARGARWIRRQLAAGVLALTTVSDDGFRAATITACAIVSVEPPQVLVALEQESQMSGWLELSGVFGLSLMARQQQFLADQFAGFAPLASRSFQGIRYFTAVTGAPLLKEAIGWIDARIVQQFETGDHRCFIADVVDLGRADGREDEPLVYFRNGYRSVT